jgi:ribosomal protein S27AE
VICSYCKQDLPKTSFYSYNKYTCKKCGYLSTKEFRKTEVFKNRQKLYFRKWYENHKEEFNKKRRNNDNSEWKLANKEKVYAQNLCRVAVRKGLIKKSKKCEMCGREKVLLSGHHVDYKNPLSVIWVCGSCHKKIHKEMILTIK